MGVIFHKNGFLFLLFITLMMASCGIFQSSPERVDRSPSPKKEIEKEEQRDTLSYEIGSVDTSDASDPTTAGDSLALVDTMEVAIDSGMSMDHDRRYRIGLFLPYLPPDKGGIAEAQDSSDSIQFELIDYNKIFTEYAAGLSLAFREFKAEFPELKYRFELLESGDYDEALLEDPAAFLEDFEADIVMGGITPPSLNLLSEFSLREERMYISPWLSQRPREDNPLFVQMSPPMDAYCAAFAEDIAAHFDWENIHIVVPSHLNGRVDCILQELEKIDSGATAMVNVVVLDSIEEEGDDLKSIFPKKDTSVVLLPLDREDLYIHDVLKYLRGLEKRSFVIYGFSSWKKFELIQDYFEKLPIRLASNAQVCVDSLLYRTFEENFFEQFGTLPGEWATRGYDQGLFLAHGLYYYGLDFIKYLYAIEVNSLAHHFSFIDSRDEHLEGFHPLNNANQGVFIVKYHNNSFQIIRRVSP